MPVAKGFKVSFTLMRLLDDEYQRIWQQHMALQPRNGDLPVGGGDWMDTFFHTEAIRGTLTALRNKKSLSDAIKDGVAVCQIAIDIWNKRREWQVRRWNGWVADYLRGVVERAKRDETASKSRGV